MPKLDLWLLVSESLVLERKLLLVSLSEKFSESATDLVWG